MKRKSVPNFGERRARLNSEVSFMKMMLVNSGKIIARLLAACPMLANHTNH
jgi:hypothetical protein